MIFVLVHQQRAMLIYLNAYFLGLFIRKYIYLCWHRLARVWDEKKKKKITHTIQWCTQPISNRKTIIRKSKPTTQLPFNHQWECGWFAFKMIELSGYLAIKLMHHQLWTKHQVYTLIKNYWSGRTVLCWKVLWFTLNLFKGEKKKKNRMIWNHLKWKRTEQNRTELVFQMQLSIAL